MSSNIYTLKIAIDDSKVREIEKRLMNIVGGNVVGAGGTPSGGGDKNAIGKNIAKLAGIAIGITTIVGLVHKIASMTIDASPMFSQMLKLLTVGFMFILRPIGDFLGFFLRPLIVYFLRTFAIPFYRDFAPIMRKLGALLGTGFLANTQKAADAGGKPFWEEGFGLEDAFKNLESNVLGWGAIFDLLAPGTFDNVEQWISDFKTNMEIITNLPTTIINKIETFIGNLQLPSITILVDKVREWVDKFKLPSWWVYIFAKIRVWINDIKLPTLGALLEMWDEWIASMSLPSWDDVYTIIKQAKDTIFGVIDAIKQFLSDILAKITGDDGKGGNVYIDTVTQTFEGAAKQGEEWWNSTADWFGTILNYNNQGSNG